MMVSILNLRVCAHVRFINRSFTDRYFDWADQVLLINNRRVDVLAPSDKLLEAFECNDSQKSNGPSKQLNKEPLLQHSKVDDAASDAIRRTGDFEVYSKRP